MVPKNRDENKWLASELPSLSCYCAGQTQLSQALPFIQYCWIIIIIIIITIIIKIKFILFILFWDISCLS